MNITAHDYIMFEIYAREYKRFMGKGSIESIFDIESKMNKINEELTRYVKELCKLDLEFKKNSYIVPDPIKYYLENGKTLNPFDYINNTNWEGFWKKCCGKDLEYFISYLEYPIIYPNNEVYLDNNKDLTKTFKFETGLDKIPYSLVCAEVLNKKYFNIEEFREKI